MTGWWMTFSARLEGATGIVLLWPQGLLLALLPVLLFAGAALLRKRRSRMRTSPADPLLWADWSALVELRDLGPRPRKGRRARSAWVPMGLLGLAGLMLAVVAARPAERVGRITAREGVAIAIVLDRSSSMERRESSEGPRRIDRAREAAKRFIAGRPRDALALVSFAKHPDLLAPPTRDHEALIAFLDELETVPADDPEDATGIGTAIGAAARSLAGIEAETRLVVLLTDGGETVAGPTAPKAIAPMHASQLCKELGLILHVIHCGAESERDATVAGLAAWTGGRAFAAEDADALAATWETIDALTRAPFEEARFRYRELSLWPARAALLLLGLAGLASLTLWRSRP